MGCTKMLLNLPNFYWEINIYIDVKKFWDSFSEVVNKLAPKNKSLIQKNTNISWYNEKSLIDELEEISLNVPLEEEIFSLPVQFVNRCISLFPDDITYLEKKYKLLTFIGDQNAALDCLITLNKISPTIESIREISNIYIDKGEIEKSEETIQGFFESNKSYSELYKGIRHVKAGRNKLAEEAYKNVLKKDKKLVLDC